MAGKCSTNKRSSERAELTCSRACRTHLHHILQRVPIHSKSLFTTHPSSHVSLFTTYSFASSYLSPHAPLLMSLYSKQVPIHSDRARPRSMPSPSPIPQ